MKVDALSPEPVLVIGNGQLVASIAVCLLAAGHFVSLLTNDPGEANDQIRTHFDDMRLERKDMSFEKDRITITDSWEGKTACTKAIIITEEDLHSKKTIIREVEEKLSPDAVIAINTESISLTDLQENARYPERIIGLNWTSPAHTTKFLEFIQNDVTKKDILALWIDIAKNHWHKDPYVTQENGIRSRLMSAMAREAFYLVENGFASVEDVDRACRNDAGYYLPFAGNCRYMDLMGTYAYGMVMKDLNPDLSKEAQLPKSFIDIIEKGGLGMENDKGLYDYSEEDKKGWQEVLRRFSYQIQKIMEKYPFNYE